MPGFPATADAPTAAGTTTVLGGQIAGVIAADLGSSGLFRPVDASGTPVAPADVTAPRFAAWSAKSAQALITGNVTANPDGGITVACYAYDVVSTEELARQGFVTTAANWRRAAHKCADLVYSRLTGETGYFDSRIVYVSETGPKTRRIKRLAVMDQDGANHRFLTNGQNLVLTPRFAPNQQTLTYMSFADNRPRIWLYTIGSGHQEAVGDTGNMSSAPRFSPDGQTLVYSISQNGATDIYKMTLSDRRVTRLTHGPGISTAPSFSPDGSRIVFESDRGGGQQVYVMNADGSEQHRISFGDGRAGTPVWSPRGDLIAFTRLGQRQVPHRCDEARRQRRAAADQRVPGRRPDVVAERARHPVLPDAGRQPRQGRPPLGRSVGGERADNKNAARCVRPGVVAVVAVTSPGQDRCRNERNCLCCTVLRPSR